MLIYKPGKTNRANALSQQPVFTPDPYNNEPVLTLPEELFVKPNSPVLDVRTYAQSMAKHSAQNHGILSGNGILQICIYEISNDICSSPVDREVMMEQSKHTLMLHQ